MGSETILFEIDKTRLAVSRACDPLNRTQLGQFFTPIGIARFMASLLTPRTVDYCYLLDAGAGIGSLSAAFLERWASGGFDFQRVEIDAFEIDGGLHSYLAQTLDKYSKHLNIIPHIRGNDFIHAAVDSLDGGLFAGNLPRYTYAILNPPYKKMDSDSSHRLALRRIGIETVNLYSAFVALSLSLLQDHGQLVAIIPRSFCNGPYYRSFREHILRFAAIQHIHLFLSRNKAFKDDAVLQENVIIMLERGGEQGDVIVTTSTDDSFSDVKTHKFSFDRIVSRDDGANLIHVPTSPGESAIERLGAIHYTLGDIGVWVSTGPVVDFRVSEYLRHMSEADTVPLLYPCHFSGGAVNWPRHDSKKPNAIQRNTNTEKLLYPNGFYCVVRRFSSKEEKRRIVASVVEPEAFDSDALGFENHLNVFHGQKKGLPEDLVRGLAAFLNTTAVDEHFRRFNGHTQVNVTDLRLMKYPSRETLIALGKWTKCKNAELTRLLLNQQLDEIVNEYRAK